MISIHLSCRIPRLSLSDKMNAPDRVVKTPFYCSKTCLPKFSPRFSGLFVPQTLIMRPSRCVYLRSRMRTSEGEISFLQTKESVLDIARKIEVTLEERETRLRARSDRFFRQYRAIFVSNIDSNQHLPNTNVTQQSILIIKLKKSDLLNANVELQKATKCEFINFENLYNSFAKPRQICNTTFTSI